MTMHILSAGCCFPAGPTLALADVAVKASLSLARKHPFWVDQGGEPIRASYFPFASHAFDVSRWETIANAALMDLSTHLTLTPLTQRYRLWLVLPPLNRPGVPENLVPAISDVAKRWFSDSCTISVIHGGHAASAQAMMDIMQAQNQDAEMTIDILLAIDSYLSIETLAWLEQQQLLHGSRSFNRKTSRINPYGRIPGEGSAAIAISRHHHGSHFCRMSGIAIGNEERLYQDKQPCIGEGLSAAALQALTQSAAPKVALVVTDFNGEPYRADEYGFTVLRLHQYLDEEYQRQTPVLATGDLGCASLASHMALMSWHLCNLKLVNADQQSDVLLLSSSDDKSRAAIVLTAL